jgi:VanZ family protein
VKHQELPTTPGTEPRQSVAPKKPRGRREFAWLVLGAAGFTVYGSLVPLQFREISLADALDAFWAVLAAGVKIDSRSDALANVMLGTPFGFALLGLVCVDRSWPRAKAVLIGLFLLPVCALFAASVEFSQLFTAARVCSTSDIAAQSFGSLVGMGVWVLWGQALTDHARAIWYRADVDAAGRLLLAYLALVVFIQTLPFDLTASPHNVYGKFRDGGVRFVPFGEFRGATSAERWAQIAKLVKLAGLYVPVGLLAAQLKGRVEGWSTARVALAALALGVCMEAIQIPIRSRVSSATDALVGALAALAGWYAARVHREGLAVPFVASWGVVWCAGMTVVTQSPPDTLKLETPRRFDWTPGLPLVSSDPMSALENMLTKLVLFGLLGVVIAAWRLPPRRRRGSRGSLRSAVVLAAALGLLLSGFFENGQRWYNEHTPSITDVLLGGLGAGLGVLVASRARPARSPRA